MSDAAGHGVAVRVLSHTNGDSRMPRSAYILGPTKYSESASPKASQACNQLSIDSHSGTLESPAFPTPYRSDLSCLYNISTVSSNVIHLTFLSFDLADNNRNSGQCLEAYVLVIVVDRLGKEHIGNRLCGNSLPSKIETMQPTVYVQFVTTAPGRHHRGFRMRYDILYEGVIKEPPSYIPDDEKEFKRDCGGATKPGQLTGEILSPGYPITYPRNVTCYWLIRVEPRQRVYIRLAHLQLSATIAECERASLSIIDGYKHDSNAIRKDISTDTSEARFCGSQLYYTEEGMKSYLSSGNRLLVRLNTKDRPSTSIAGQRVGFKLIWTAVEGLFDELNPSSALTSSEQHRGTPKVDTCTQFTCQGGQICVEQDQGVCAMRPQLCIHSSLVCNGVQNCVEGDDSDEQHCYSREIIAGSLAGFLSLMAIVFICVCCDQWRKRRRLRKMLRERRAVANGKTQRAFRHDVHLNHDIGFDRVDVAATSRYAAQREENDIALPRYNRGLPPRPPPR
ncbi:CUB domain and Low-density lipoprotein (LDL) receptor class A repeat-containing protein [Trichostrongylus colubriformis]|uniref:CUB domain and Low-density lipoprotein (LDL) receptor class A repeat-containing protein n=1 Tax=Trichostrongylus colubriformis TaxID=6319 RepID=A0AAN8EMU2_TRICO